MPRVIQSNRVGAARIIRRLRASKPIASGARMSPITNARLLAWKNSLPQAKFGARRWRNPPAVRDCFSDERPRRLNTSVVSAGAAKAATVSAAALTAQVTIDAANSVVGYNLQSGSFATLAAAVAAADLAKPIPLCSRTGQASRPCRCTRYASRGGRLNVAACGVRHAHIRGEWSRRC